MIPLSILLRQEVDLSIMCDSIKDLRQEVDPDNSSKSIMNPSCHFAFARLQDTTHFFIITHSVVICFNKILHLSILRMEDKPKSGEIYR